MIKYSTLMILGLCATVLLHAQEMKTEISKPAEMKPIPALNIPSPVGEFIPQPGIVPKESVAVSETAAPAKSDGRISPNVGTASPVQLSEQDAKILAGKGEKPKQSVAAPVTNAPKAAAQKPVAMQQEINQ